MSEYVLILDDKELVRTCNLIALFGEGTGQVNAKPIGDMQITEKIILKQSYLDTVTKIRAAYSDYLSHIIPNNIMVEVDVNWELTDKTTDNSKWAIKIKKTTQKRRKGKIIRI